MILKDVLKDAKTIAIGGHIRPDGDCVGSCLGLYQYLKQYTSIEIDVYLETFSDVFNFMKATKDIKHTVKPDAIYDLFICLDC
ncbi:MAG: DHH family phosphoesterase, partial [Lachnospiraceae bacterium]|nr:DHH family phosphoesterase [Lachnospiraceae bacterium]